MMQKFSSNIRKGLLTPPSKKLHILYFIDYLAMMQFSTGKRTYGNLKDQDRIFTNLYKDGDVGI